MNLIEIAVNSDLEQCARVIPGSARMSMICFEPQARDIESIDEHIHNPNTAVFLDIVVDSFGEQGALVPILALDETARSSPRCRKAVFYFSDRVFTQPRPMADVQSSQFTSASA